MTERIYYTNSFDREFDATIVGVDRAKDRTLVRLDRTAFYPTSGGQPFDTGALGGARVVDVLDEDGDVTHVFDGHESQLRVGQPVHGVIDWERRFDHMQQHSGQHVLSAAFDQLFRARTVSFHLGTESSTIDLARELSGSEIALAEEQASRIVWDDRPVCIRFASAEEAEKLPLRKESARHGTLRLIDIEGFDLSACGGTHVARTGAIGTIVVASWERVKGGQRIEFLCGGRALQRFRALRDLAAASVERLSVATTDVPGAIGRLQAEVKEQRRLLTALHADLSRYRAEELAASAESLAAGRFVAQALDADANVLKTIAAAITSRPGFVVALVSATTPVLIVVARSQDANMRSNEILAAVTKAFGGRGGGKVDLAQGGGLNAQPQEVLDAVRRLIVVSGKTEPA